MNFTIILFTIGIIGGFLFGLIGDGDLCLSFLGSVAGFFFALVIAIPSTLWLVIPHYSYNTEIIDTKSYSLIELNEIDNEYFEDENTYLIYDAVNDDFIYYYKDEKGVIRQDSVSASSDLVSIVRNNSTTLNINTRDYTSKTLKHLLLNGFSPEYVLNIPEDSEIHYLYPEFIG